MGHHDHTKPTHFAKCDDCDYVAETHVHTDDEAIGALTYDLALHNKNVHNRVTNPDDIKEAVRGKMKTND